MGYDITFHPVGLEELQHFVFDVVNDKALASVRATSLTKDVAKQRKILALYDELQRWRNPLDWGANTDFSNSIAYVTAAIASFLHPYWYARGAAIAFLKDQDSSIAGLFVPLNSIAEGYTSEIPDASQGLLSSNYTASGVILHEKIPALRGRLEELRRHKKSRKLWGLYTRKAEAPLCAVFDQESLRSLENALEYADRYDLGIMEAADVIVPMADQTVTDPDNLRSAWTKNQDDSANSRDAP